jgi:hypothetical protein
MNVDRLVYIAEWLEAGAPTQGKVKGFNMRFGVSAEAGDTPQCGTTCCIAGAATQFFNDEDGWFVTKAFDFDSEYKETNEAPWDVVQREATHILGLDHFDALCLFQPERLFGGELSDYNDPLRAARVIRNFIATGIVDWRIK